MGESHSEKRYTVCGNCGQRALTVATRCPHCRHPFDAHFYQRTTATPISRRIPIGLIAAALVITVAVANLLRRYLTAGRQTAASGPVVPAPPTPARLDSAALVVSPRPTPAPEAFAPPGDSLPAAPHATDTTTARTDEATAPPGVRRYATTWVNVRAERSGTAQVVRVLAPGDVVEVEGLRQGWFRLVSAQLPAGYVDGRFLDSLPPATP